MLKYGWELWMFLDFAFLTRGSILNLLEKPKYVLFYFIFNNL